MLGRPTTVNRLLDPWLGLRPRIPTNRRYSWVLNHRIRTRAVNRRISRTREAVNRKTSRQGRAVINPGKNEEAVSARPNLVLYCFWRVGSDAFAGGAVKGFVKGFKNLVSSNPPPQQQPQQPQQQTVTSSAKTQQPPNNASSSTVNFGSHTIPLVLRIPTGPQNQSNNNGSTSGHNNKPNKLGPFNGAYPISPPSPSDDNTGNQNKPRLGPFNGAYPISPPNQFSSGTSNVPSHTTGGGSGSNQVNKPRLGPFNGAYPISPPSPTDGGAGNQNNKPKLGPFNGAYPISTPTQSLSSGSSALQNPNDTTPGTTPDTTPVTTPGTTPAQKSDNVWKALSQRSHSTDSLSYASEDEDTGAVKGQGSGPDQDTGKDGDGGPGGDGVAADDADSASISYSVYPPSTVPSDHGGTCGLEGCSNSTFVDPITDLESEYCSWKHQE